MRVTLFREINPWLIIYAHELSPNLTKPLSKYSMVLKIFFFKSYDKRSYSPKSMLQVYEKIDLFF